ncbi:MAG: hypothetical protein ANABAC_0186 [Anaerolineae bacterium]|nr:MAG: hypothetical protein ANABAC_0186 [Anaerolineae bacterium]
MWKRITNPDILIYLDVNYPNTLLRKKLNWTPQEYREQLQRLTHARQHADLIIDTNPLTEDEVSRIAISFIENWKKER